ncbi:MAG: urease accessory protein UreD, partial [Granulosicoccaceae bacterium]
MPLAQTGVAPPSPDQAASNVAGWRAELALRFRRLEQRTVLKHSHAGPLRVQRPFYPEGEVCHVYLVHPPAGVVGGDDLQVRIDASAKSAALVTTPGATQFYRSAGDRATVAQQIALTGARLDWLPQENIYFDGAMVEVDT